MSVHKHQYDDIKAWHYVYFIITRETTGPGCWVKIGLSGNPIKRAMDLMTGIAIEIKKFGYLTCPSRVVAAKLEYDILDLFSDRKSKFGTEWLKFDMDDKDERALLMDGISACANALDVSMSMQIKTGEELIELRRAFAGERRLEAGKTLRGKNRAQRAEILRHRDLTRRGIS